MNPAGRVSSQYILISSAGTQPRAYISNGGEETPENGRNFTTFSLLPRSCADLSWRQFPHADLSVFRASCRFEFPKRNHLTPTNVLLMWQAGFVINSENANAYCAPKKKKKRKSPFILTTLNTQQLRPVIRSMFPCVRHHGVKLDLWLLGIVSFICRLDPSNVVVFTVCLGSICCISHFTPSEMWTAPQCLCCECFCLQPEWHAQSELFNVGIIALAFSKLDWRKKQKGKKKIFSEQSCTFAIQIFNKWHEYFMESLV